MGINQRDAPFLALKKLHGQGIVRTAARHNLREIQTESGADGHIDATRMGDNSTIAGPATADGVAALADRLTMVKRKDAVRAIEILCSLPPESRIDTDAYFADSLQWARDYLALPVLSAVIHRDEAAPHMHVLLLQLVNGRMRGNAVMGNRQRLQALQTNFFERVGVRYGLARPKATKRLDSATRNKCAELVYTAIVSDSNMLRRPAVKQAILDAFKLHPEPLLGALGLSLPTTVKPGKSFVEIMARPCKPEPRQSNTIAFATPSKPIGIERQPAKKVEHYVSVVFNSRTASCCDNDEDIPGGNLHGKCDHWTKLECARLRATGLEPCFQLPSTEMLPFSKHDAAISDDYIRSSDDMPAACWDSDIGEFVPLPAARRSQTRLGGDCGGVR